jgi:hypothetical protein
MTSRVPDLSHVKLERQVQHVALQTWNKLLTAFGIRNHTASRTERVEHIPGNKLFRNAVLGDNKKARLAFLRQFLWFTATECPLMETLVQFGFHLDLVDVCNSGPGALFSTLLDALHASGPECIEYLHQAALAVTAQLGTGTSAAVRRACILNLLVPVLAANEDTVFGDSTAKKFWLSAGVHMWVLFEEEQLTTDTPDGTKIRLTAASFAATFDEATFFRGPATPVDMSAVTAPVPEIVQAACCTEWARQHVASPWLFNAPGWVLGDIPKPVPTFLDALGADEWTRGSSHYFTSWTAEHDFVSTRADGIRGVNPTWVSPPMVGSRGIVAMDTFGHFTGTALVGLNKDGNNTQHVCLCPGSVRLLVRMMVEGAHWLCSDKDRHTRSPLPFTPTQVSVQTVDVKPGTTSDVIQCPECLDILRADSTGTGDSITRSRTGAYMVVRMFRAFKTAFSNEKKMEDPLFRCLVSKEPINEVIRTLLCAAINSSRVAGTPGEEAGVSTLLDICNDFCTGFSAPTEERTKELRESTFQSKPRGKSSLLHYIPELISTRGKAFATTSAICDKCWFCEPCDWATEKMSNPALTKSGLSGNTDRTRVGSTGSGGSGIPAGATSTVSGSVAVTSTSVPRRLSLGRGTS